MERVLPLGTGELCLGSPGCGGVVGGLGGALGCAGGKAGAGSARGDPTFAFAGAMPRAQHPSASKPPPAPLQAVACPCRAWASTLLPRGPIQPPTSANPRLGGPRHSPGTRSALCCGRAVAGGSRAAWPLGGLCRGQQLCSGTARRWNTEGSLPSISSTRGLLHPTLGSCAGITVGGSSRRELGAAGDRGPGSSGVMPRYPECLVTFLGFYFYAVLASCLHALPWALGEERQQ